MSGKAPYGLALSKMLLLVCCVALSISAAGNAAEKTTAKEDVCTGADMGEYAKLLFCLPPEVVVEPESMNEANYTGGREVAASMLLDGSRVGLHLLYPCEAPNGALLPSEIKPYIVAYAPELAGAAFDENATDEGSLLFGQIGNQNLIAAQPNNQTIALILLDRNMSEELTASFVGNLSIFVNESIAPPSNCLDVTASETVAPVATEPAVAPVEESSTDASPASGQSTAASGIDAARARLEKLRGK